jgi:hypothetical protein
MREKSISDNSLCRPKGRHGDVGLYSPIHSKEGLRGLNLPGLMLRKQKIGKKVLTQSNYYVII